MFFFAAAVGLSGSSRPLAASSPVQSLAPTTTSGASAAATVLRFVRMSPNCFWTMLTVMPFDWAHALATWVTAAWRSLSVQIVRVVAEVFAGRADAAATANRTTAIAPIATSAKREKRLLYIINSYR